VGTALREMFTNVADPTCRDCKAVLKWKEPYEQGARPVNPDGTAHNCKAPQPKAPRPEVPIEQIVAEIQAIKGVIYPNTPAQTDDNLEPELSPEMVEGIWKYAISRKMR